MACCLSGTGFLCMGCRTCGGQIWALPRERRHTSVRVCERAGGRRGERVRHGAHTRTHFFLGMLAVRHWGGKGWWNQIKNIYTNSASDVVSFFLSPVHWLTFVAKGPFISFNQPLETVHVHWTDTKSATLIIRGFFSTCDTELKACIQVLS